MSESARDIDEQQRRWAGSRVRDPRRNDYLASLSANLFQRDLHPSTKNEFRAGDGSELNDSRTRPAKMRALASSSALVVNFFDVWRDRDKTVLAGALGLPAPITDMQFEFKTRGYPVRPRSPNLDLLIHLENGELIGVESKFVEPFRSDDGHGVLSARYFPSSESLWSNARLDGAQGLASRLRPEWIHLDAPQLLKHMLGLANDPAKPSRLLYLWFDTNRADAGVHRHEVESFASAVAGDGVAFCFTTYQAVFERLPAREAPVEGWHAYMQERYFPLRPAI
jgi:hypothetical protein